MTEHLLGHPLEPELAKAKVIKITVRGNLYICTKITWMARFSSCEIFDREILSPRDFVSGVILLLRDFVARDFGSSEILWKRDFVPRCRRVILCCVIFSCSREAVQLLWNRRFCWKFSHNRKSRKQVDESVCSIDQGEYQWSVIPNNPNRWFQIQVLKSRGWDLATVGGQRNSAVVEPIVKRSDMIAGHLATVSQAYFALHKTLHQVQNF